MANEMTGIAEQVVGIPGRGAPAAQSGGPLTEPLPAQETLEMIHKDREAWERRWRELGYGGIIEQASRIFLRFAKLADEAQRARDQHFQNGVELMRKNFSLGLALDETRKLLEATTETCQKLAAERDDLRQLLEAMKSAASLKTPPPTA